MYAVLAGRLFEGKIHLVKKTYYDTLRYTYHVRDSMVRINEYNEGDELMKSLLVNLKDKRVFAIHPDKKLYKELKLGNTRNNFSYNDNFEVIKTGNTKEINGYICQQWRVRNRAKNSEIVYWVTKNSFYFVNKLINTLGNEHNYRHFFSKIPNNQGYMPILTVERTLVREEKLRLLVTDIEKESPSADYFKIPADYKYYDH
jgi:hypothetical protein